MEPPNVEPNIFNANNRERNFAGQDNRNRNSPIHQHQQRVLTNNNNNEPQTQNLFHMRDRLFLALFFRVSLVYARAFPKTLRRILEYCLLMQSILFLFVLGYIHIVYTRSPCTCLAEYKDSWSRDGILRVEIANEPIDLQKSYEKEEKLRQRNSASLGHYGDDLISMMLAADTLILDRVVSTAGQIINSVTSSRVEKVNPEDENKELQPITATTTPENIDPTSIEAEKTVMVENNEQAPPPNEKDENNEQKTEEESNNDNINNGENLVKEQEISSGSGISSEPQETKNVSILDDDEYIGDEILVTAHEDIEFEKLEESIKPTYHVASGIGGGEGVGTSQPAAAIGIEPSEETDPNDPESPYFNKTLEEIEIMKMEKKQLEEETILKSTPSDFDRFANSVWLQDHAYIVEYALEYGFLRLSPETRQKLNIPVKIVTLDPNKEECFGNGFSRFLLDHFLGYDDILMSSIKNLAEQEDNKGYLRNVVSGEQFRFIPVWMARSSYIPALLIMLVFTISISMLLRHSHHQIFVFIVDLLNNIEGTDRISIPAAPLFCVILALVGMEAIMSEVFNDTSTAFYVILIVWIADQYDSVCSHTETTKLYWVRFFYLYHFAFYAYHYRFNGQYGSLALIVSWSFIQHSMVYFYHHYELPAILRQAHQSEEQNNLPVPENNNNVNVANPNSNRNLENLVPARGTLNNDGANLPNISRTISSSIDVSLEPSDTTAGINSNNTISSTSSTSSNSTLFSSSLSFRHRPVNAGQRPNVED